ncbi:MAG: threonine ammonia-lyase [Candidatus Thorarchaeota archaeon]
MSSSNQEYIKEIEKIKESFSDLIHYTPLELNHTFSVMSNNEVYLKLENFQRTGAFKIRGAYNKILKLSEKEKRAGVITASAGNHGQAVALAAKLFNTTATIVVPEGTPIVKIEAIKNYFGNVIEYGRTYDDAFNKAIEIKEKENLPFIHAFNDLDVIKGQATLGLEILEQLPDVEYIFCPIGGGGLISGISSYCKAKNKKVKIIGVQSDNARSMYESLRTNELTILESQETICEGIAVERPGDITYEMVKKYVDEIVLVSDEEVANAILLLLERAKIFVEGAGATALAAVLNKKVNIENKKIVVLISGGNLTPNLLNRIIIKGLINEGRLVKLKTIIPDVPGALLKLLNIIAEERGNIVSIIHDRERLEVSYKKAEVILEIETRNQEHINQIVKELEKRYEIEILKF